MPVSWQSRLSVSSATRDVAHHGAEHALRAGVGLASPASASKPCLMSGGSILQRADVELFAPLPRPGRGRPSLHLDLALPHHARPERAFLLHLARHLLRRVADRRESLHVEPPAQVARLERLLRCRRRPSARCPSASRWARRGRTSRCSRSPGWSCRSAARREAAPPRSLLVTPSARSRPPWMWPMRGGDVAEEEAGLAADRGGEPRAFALVGHARSRRSSPARRSSPPRGASASRCRRGRR